MGIVLPDGAQVTGAGICCAMYAAIAARSAALSAASPGDAAMEPWVLMTRLNTVPVVPAALSLVPEGAAPWHALQLAVHSVAAPAGTGVTGCDPPDAALVAVALVAVTEQVYVVPLVKPRMTIGAAVLVDVAPPGRQVAV